jgi:Ca-activated chloride channel homolog
MSFAHPWLLLLLAAPLAALLWGWRQHGHQIAVPFDHSGAPSRRWSTAVLRAVHSLPLALLAIAIIILAGPRRWGLPQDQRVMTNIEFLVDVSGSMTAPYGDGNRYDAAMVSVLDFIDRRQGDAFGLIVFGDSLLEWVPLTSDPSALKHAPEFLSPLKLPTWFSGGTSIGAALEHTLKVMTARTDGDRMIILITDGDSSDLAGGRDAAIAAKLRDAGIQVFCIHIDNSAPPAEVTTIASQTGGQVFAAGDPSALTAVFQRIDEMKKARLEKVSAETQDDFFPWSVAGGAALALWWIAMLAGLRYTPW